jgi:hypothetical protein
MAVTMHRKTAAHVGTHNQRNSRGRPACSSSQAMVAAASPDMFDVTGLSTLDIVVGRHVLYSSAVSISAQRSDGNLNSPSLTSNAYVLRHRTGVHC